MNKPILRKWILALTSGRFGQCTGSLHADGNFCPWGVLTELYRRDFGGEWEAGDLETPIKRFSFQGYSGGAPPCVFDWLGASPVDLGVPVVPMNDVGEMTFNRIAEILKKCLLPWDWKLEQVIKAVYESCKVYPYGPVQAFLTEKLGMKIVESGTPWNFDALTSDTEAQIKDIRAFIVEEKKKTDFGYCLWHELDALQRIIDAELG